jgi:hypothetical protein
MVVMTQSSNRLLRRLYLLYKKCIKSTFTHIGEVCPSVLSSRKLGNKFTWNFVLGTYSKVVKEIMIFFHISEMQGESKRCEGCETCIKKKILRIKSIKLTLLIAATETVINVRTYKVRCVIHALLCTCRNNR